MTGENQDQNELVFVPLGGCGEIGMNLNLFGFGPPNDRKWIVVDIGVTFGDLSTPGIDVIMPDPEYIAQYKDDLLGIVVTHGHEDHIGAVAHLWPYLRCPIFVTPFTSVLVASKLAERGLLDEAPLEVIDLEARFDLGPFDIEYITLTHSTLEPNALAIRTPLGIILHTGDWKIDPDPVLGDVTNKDRLAAIGEEGVLAMVCDSTNVFVPGSAGSEADVRESLIDLVGTLTGRVVITTFASNVARVASVIEAARANDRHVALAGRSMLRVVEAARETGYLTDFANFVPEDEAGFLPPEKILYICTGSQGEPRAALGRIARGDHSHITIEEGDTVIFSSRVIPGNERGIYALQNELTELGVDIITARDHFVHVSGHPCRDELAQMYQWVKPKLAVPVHGEMRHLREHQELAHELQVPQVCVTGNGGMMRLAPGRPEIVDQVPSGRLHLDGDLLVSAADTSLRERKKLSFGGLVVALLIFDRAGDLLEGSEVSTYGMPEVKGMSGRTIAEALEDDIFERVEDLPVRERNIDKDVERAVRQVGRARLRSSWGKRPQFDVRIIRID